jgi:hypothetical protein
VSKDDKPVLSEGLTTSDVSKRFERTPRADAPFGCLLAFSTLYNGIRPIHLGAFRPIRLA